MMRVSCFKNPIFPLLSVLIFDSHISFELGYENIAKILIDNKVNVNTIDNSSYTPLHWLAMAGNNLWINYK